MIRSRNSRGDAARSINTKRTEEEIGGKRVKIISRSRGSRGSAWEE